MRQSLLHLSLLFMASVMSAQVGDSSIAEKLLQRYTNTYGGLRDTNRLASIRIEGVQIQEGQEYAFLMHKKRPSSIRYRLQQGETVLVAGYNGRDGWLQTTRDGASTVEALSGTHLEALRSEAFFEGPLYRHLEKPENTVTFDGVSEVGGLASYSFKVVDADGSVSRYFLDRRDARVQRVDRLDEAGQIRIQTLYRDYQDVAGYPFAHEVENRIDGETISLIRIDRVSVNPGLLSLFFEVPAE